METLSFVSDGLRCVGDLRLPEKGSGPYPAVLICNGMSLPRDSWLVSIAEGLARAGYASFSFDYRCFGESEGAPRGRLIPQLQVRDARSALDLLRSRSDIDTDRLALYGSSMGASVGLAVTGLEPAIRCAVLTACIGNYRRIWEAFPGFEAFRAKVATARARYVATGEVSQIKTARVLAAEPEVAQAIAADAAQHPHWPESLTFEGLLDLFEFEPERELATLGERPLLWISAEHSALVPFEEVERMRARAGERCEHRQLAGVRHVQLYKDPAVKEQVLGYTLEWLDAHLR